MTAARRVARCTAAWSWPTADRVLAEVPLPLGGLMSAEPVETVQTPGRRGGRGRRALGSPLHDPFMAMSFLALEVIPSLKLTDKGLVDVDRLALVPTVGRVAIPDRKGPAMQ